MSLIFAAILLFLVMDPLGNISFFLLELKKLDPDCVKAVVRLQLPSH